MKIREIARITSISGKQWPYGIAAKHGIEKAKWERILGEMQVWATEIMGDSDRIRNYDILLMLPEGKVCDNNE